MDKNEIAHTAILFIFIGTIVGLVGAVAWFIVFPILDKTKEEIEEVEIMETIGEFEGMGE